MIRVVAALPGVPFRAALTGRPELADPDAAEILRQLETSRFDEPTREAIRRAVSELRGRSPDVTIVAGAGLYRVFVGVAPTPVPLESEWPAAREPWAKEKGAPVVVSGTHPAVASLGEVLRFLGYDARVVIATDAHQLAAVLAEHRPAAAIFAVAAGATLDEKILAACRAHGCAIVRTGQSVSPGIDGVLPLPIATGQIADLLDPLIRSARSAAPPPSPPPP